MPQFLVEISFVAAPDESGVSEQRAFLERLTSDGTLLLAAVLPEKPGKGIAIVSAKSLDAARAIYDEAPLFKRGVMEWTMTSLNPTYGAFVAMLGEIR